MSLRKIQRPRRKLTPYLDDILKALNSGSNIQKIATKLDVSGSLVWLELKLAGYTYTKNGWEKE